MDHNDASTTEPGLASRVFTRRSAVKAAAWSVPVITVVSAAPAFALSNSVLTATYNADSFRANSNAELTGGTPSAGQFVAIDIALNFTGTPLANLTCTLTSANNGVAVANNSVSPARGSTTWAAGSGDLAANGFTSVSPAIGAGQANTVTFTKSTPSTTSPVRLKCVLTSIGNTDFPLVFKFSSTETVSTATVTVTSPGTTPFLAGG